MLRASSGASSISETPRSKKVTLLPRSYPRLILSISFILFASGWLVFTGLRLKLPPTSPLYHYFRRSNSTDGLKEKMAASSVAKTPFVINSQGTATAVFIFLHGLGDTGQGWCSLFKSISQKHIKYIFPNADAMPVTLNMGMVMPSWFDITSLNASANEDEKGIKKAAESVRAMIKKEQEAAAIPSHRVFLGGFSMGGALALYTGLTHPEPLGGLVLLSSWLPLKDKFVKCQDGLSLANQTCPVFQGHGDSDPLVQTAFGSATHEILSTARKNAWKSDPAAVFKTYRGVGHSSSDKEMKDVEEFVKKYLAAV